jgi:hypothetical protein
LCLLEALGYRESDETQPLARAYVGAMLLIDVSRELTLLRRILVKALSSNG